MAAGYLEDVFSPAVFHAAEGVSVHSVVDVLNGLGDCPRILKHSEVKYHGIHGSPHSRDTESSYERDLRAFRWQESMFNMI